MKYSRFHAYPERWPATDLMNCFWSPSLATSSGLTSFSWVERVSEDDMTCKPYFSMDASPFTLDYPRNVMDSRLHVIVAVV